MRHDMRRTIVLIGVLMAASGMFVSAATVDSFDLPSFPSPPLSLVELTADATESVSASASVAVDATSTQHAGSGLAALSPPPASLSDRPTSDLALASLLPSDSSNPVTAALSLSVPDPRTFLRDDVFLQQLDRQRATADAKEAAEHQGEVAAGGFYDDLVSSRPLSPPPRRRGQNAQVTSTAAAAADASPRAGLSNLYNNKRLKVHGRTAGRQMDKKGGGLFHGHARIPLAHRLPLHEQAPHQPPVDRSYKSGRGAFETNKAWRDNHQPTKIGFPHHGGHANAPHNQGRATARVNQPMPIPSRHIRAQRKGSKTNEFPKPRGLRQSRIDKRMAIRARRAAKDAALVPLAVVKKKKVESNADVTTKKTTSAPINPKKDKKKTKLASLKARLKKLAAKARASLAKRRKSTRAVLKMKMKRFIGSKKAKTMKGKMTRSAKKRFAKLKRSAKKRASKMKRSLKKRFKKLFG